MPLSRIGRFLLVSIAALLVLMLPWYHLSPYLAAPVIEGAGALMRFGFHWVEGVQREGTVGTLLTTLHVIVSQGHRSTVGELTPEANYRTFGYGVVLLWALLLGSRPQGLPVRLLIGSLALLPLQAISLCFQWLKDSVIAGGPQVLAQTGLPHWTLEVIAYGYQFGFLMLTPLAPVLLWLLLDRQFVQGMWVEMALASAIEQAESPTR